ncbi:MAG TPA: hypothetical protein VHL11_13395, partial [Phototrophicaceae bacterium]|nr:hypothetical protein [Phototrophicaceae bacterium]
YELRPPIAINKGTVFNDLINTYRLDAAIFIGDDTTDVDALRVTRVMRDQGKCFALGIGVESDGTPPTVLEAADVLVIGVSGVEELLEWLVNALDASSD